MEKSNPEALRTMTSREFNQDTGLAKKAAHFGPVIITDRGKPAHVLLTYESYLEIVELRQSIADLLSYRGAGETDLELPDFPEKAQPPRP